MRILAFALMVTLSLNAFGSVKKNERRLLVVTNLVTNGSAKYEWLYSFLEAQTISMAKAKLENKYKKITVLPKATASKNAFVGTMKNITKLNGLRALDVILSMHGTPERLWFSNGSMKAVDLQEKIKSEVQYNFRLRMMYNLACYGSTHRNNFINAGFLTAIGARGINANSGYEYATFLNQFGNNASVKSILQGTNNSPLLGTSDAAAVSAGFSKADSYKRISGKKSMRIMSNAVAF